MVHLASEHTLNIDLSHEERTVIAAGSQSKYLYPRQSQAKT